MSMVSKRGVFALVAAAVFLLLSGCATGDYGALTGTWVGELDQKAFLFGYATDLVDVTIKLNADKSWSWSTSGVTDSGLNSTGSGTYTLDTSAKTAQFTISTCSSSEVATGTVVTADYSVDSSGKTATFDFHGMSGTTGGSIPLAKQ
jgi:hypothetical protein